MAKTIGSARLVRENTVEISVRAEGDGLVGDLFQELSTEDFVRMGWKTDRHLSKVGDEATLLASE